MTKMRSVVLALCAVAVFGFAGQASALTQLGFVIDSSGSIDATEWNFQRTGLANAISATVPTDSSIEITVVQFGSVASQIVAPTLIDSAATLAAVTGAISTAAQGGGSTNMTAGLNLVTSLVTGSPLFGTGNELMNVSTDGFVNNPTTAAAAATAMAAAGIEGLSAEGITGANLAFLQSIVFPGVSPGPIVTAGTVPNPLTQGFVIEVATFADYEAAVTEKIGQVTNVIPEPGSAALYGLSLLVLYGSRRMLRSGSR
jgi:hypothetical protein